MPLNTFNSEVITFPQLRKQYRYDLFEDFLPFMDKHIIDHEFGGFMCNSNRKGDNITSNKNSWYDGRGLWVYSFLYNQLQRDEKYLQVARKTLEIILKNSPDGDNLWCAEYDRQGVPIEEQGILTGGKNILCSDQIYGDLFIAEGLAEYCRAVIDDDYWGLAKKIVLKCFRVYDKDNYAPSAPKVYLACDDPCELPGARLLGVWMLLLRVTTQMLRQKPDPDIEKLTDRCLDAIFNHHYNPEYNLINEVLNHDFSRPDNEYSDLVYTGHGIECLWMVMDEACRRKDKELFDKSAELFRRYLEVAWDDVYGGFFRCLKNVHENNWILDKAVWLQEEVLIGTLLIIEHTDWRWARDWFARTFKYVHSKFPLKRYGYSLWDIWTDREGTFVEEYTRIENYHHPRHLMLNLLSVEKIIERGEKASGIFS